MRMEVMGTAKRIGDLTAKLLIVNHKKEFIETKDLVNLHFNAVVKVVIEWLKNNQTIYSLIAIGFRLVMGGPRRYKPEVITEEVLRDLHDYIYLAPNHLPNELSTIQAFKEAFPQIKRIACYDTAFHHLMPFFSKYYPLPLMYRNQGLIRYGFHGLSYESIMKKLSYRKLEASGKKIIITHLGNGASMVAINNKDIIDTSMGISPLGGLVMGSRSGDLDPGAILFLLKNGHLSVNSLDNLLSKESGLKALAGISDMKELIKEADKDSLAEEALTVFCYHVKKFIGAYAAAIGGLDLLVFTGGIGENSALIRERICSDLDFMGIMLDKHKNAGHLEIISSESSKVMVCALQTDEELIIAEHTYALIDKQNKI